MGHGILHLVTGAWLASGAAWTDDVGEALSLDPDDARRMLARHAPEPVAVTIVELPVESAA